MSQKDPSESMCDLKKNDDEQSCSHIPYISASDRIQTAQLDQFHTNRPHRTPLNFNYAHHHQQSNIAPKVARFDVTQRLPLQPTSCHLAGQHYQSQNPAVALQSCQPTMNKMDYYNYAPVVSNQIPPNAYLNSATGMISTNHPSSSLPRWYNNPSALPGDVYTFDPTPTSSSHQQLLLPPDQSNYYVYNQQQNFDIKLVDHTQHHHSITEQNEVLVVPSSFPVDNLPSSGRATPALSDTVNHSEQEEVVYPKTGDTVAVDHLLVTNGGVDTAQNHGNQQEQLVVYQLNDGSPSYRPTDKLQSIINKSSPFDNSLASSNPEADALLSDLEEIMSRECQSSSTPPPSSAFLMVNTASSSTPFNNNDNRPGSGSNVQSTTANLTTTPLDSGVESWSNSSSICSNVTGHLQFDGTNKLGTASSSPLLSFHSSGNSQLAVSINSSGGGEPSSIEWSRQPSTNNNNSSVAWDLEQAMLQASTMLSGDNSSLVAQWEEPGNQQACQLSSSTNNNDVGTIQSNNSFANPPFVNASSSINNGPGQYQQPHHHLPYNQLQRRYADDYVDAPSSSSSSTVVNHRSGGDRRAASWWPGSDRRHGDQQSLVEFQLQTPPGPAFDARSRRQGHRHAIDQSQQHQYYQSIQQLNQFKGQQYPGDTSYNPYQQQVGPTSGMPHNGQSLNAYHHQQPDYILPPPQSRLHQHSLTSTGRQGSNGYQPHYNYHHSGATSLYPSYHQQDQQQPNSNQLNQLFDSAPPPGQLTEEGRSASSNGGNLCYHQSRQQQSQIVFPAEISIPTPSSTAKQPSSQHWPYNQAPPAPTSYSSYQNNNDQIMERGSYQAVFEGQLQQRSTASSVLIAGPPMPVSATDNLHVVENCFTHPSSASDLVMMPSTTTSEQPLTTTSGTTTPSPALQ